MTVFMFRPPESEGRPEKFILDSICERLVAKGKEVVSVSGQGDELPTGSNFYSLDTALNCMVAHLRALPRVADGDCIFVGDAQLPVVSSIRYYLQLKGINVRVTGLFHSSALTAGDIFNDLPPFISQDEATLQNLDCAVAATKYLADKIGHSLVTVDKVIATGLPTAFIPYASRTIPREDTVVWPHRVAKDKGVFPFTLLARQIKKKDPSIRVKVLTPTWLPDDQAVMLDQLNTGIEVVVCHSKSDYYAELAKAKVVLSTATLETFGYAVIEAVEAGCTPVVPADACYSEMYDSKCWYSSELLRAGAVRDGLARRIIREVKEYDPSVNSVSFYTDVFLKRQAKCPEDVIANLILGE